MLGPQFCCTTEWGPRPHHPNWQGDTFAVSWFNYIEPLFSLIGKAGAGSVKPVQSIIWRPFSLMQSGFCPIFALTKPLALAAWYPFGTPPRLTATCKSEVRDDVVRLGVIFEANLRTQKACADGKSKSLQSDVHSIF